MSKEILIKIRDKIADRISGEYVCGNSDFVAVFNFDEEWNTYETKTARFYYGDNYIDKPFNGDRCEIPILSNIHSFEVGVFAGNLKTSTSEYVPARKSILCKGGSPAAPSPDVYAQIMETLNDIDHMSEEEIAKAIKEYLSENGIDIDLEGVPHVYTTTEKPTDAKHGDFWARKVEVPGDAPSKDHDVVLPDENYVTEDEMHNYVRAMIREIEPEDIGALPADTEIPKNTSDLDNDSGFLTEEDLPDYTAEDIGCDITVDEQECENVGAALNALANRRVGGSSEMKLLYSVTTAEDLLEIRTGINPNDYNEILMLARAVSSDSTKITHFAWKLDDNGEIRVNDALHNTQIRSFVLELKKLNSGLWRIQNHSHQYEAEPLSNGIHTGFHNAAASVNGVAFWENIKATNIGCGAYIYGGTKLAAGAELMVWGR